MSRNYSRQIKTVNQIRRSYKYFRNICCATWKYNPFLPVVNLICDYFANRFAELITITKRIYYLVDVYITKFK